MFGSVTDERLMKTLVMGEYLLIVCQNVPMPGTMVYVRVLREEMIMRYGAYAKDVILTAVKQMLIQNPTINTAACVDTNINF
jgi:hypothetical protein